MKNKRLLGDILLYISLILIAGENVFSQTLANLDEVWVYNFARCIQNRSFTI